MCSVLSGLLRALHVKPVDGSNVQQNVLRPELLHEGIAMCRAVAYVLAFMIRGFHLFPQRGYYDVVAASNTLPFPILEQKRLS